MKSNLLVALLALAFALPSNGAETLSQLTSRAKKEGWSFKLAKKQVTHPKGLKPEHLKMLRAAPRVSYSLADVQLPAAYSLHGCQTRVENQGQCGSCWDVSLVGTLRDTLACIGRTGDPGRLSFEYLRLNCGPGPAMLGCNGGTPDAAISLIKPAGPPLYGQDGPYLGGHCDSSLKVAASANAFHMLGDSQGVVHFKDIAYVIAVLHRPVTITVAADPAWENYESGIYDACDADEGQINHMVMFDEYSCETSVTGDGKYCVFSPSGDLPAGVGLMTVKNQWDVVWGEQGRMRTKFTGLNGKKCNAAGTDTLYFDVDERPTPPSPTPVPPTPPTPPTPVPPTPPTPVGPVNGGWSSWSQCSKGWQRRFCNNPPPSNGGKACPGNDWQPCVEPCHEFACSLWCGFPWCTKK